MDETTEEAGERIGDGCRTGSGLGGEGEVGIAGGMRGIRPLGRRFGEEAREWRDGAGRGAARVCVEGRRIFSPDLDRPFSSCGICTCTALPLEMTLSASTSFMFGSKSFFHKDMTSAIGGGGEGKPSSSQYSWRIV